jgi:hypothetical protein
MNYEAKVFVASGPARVPLILNAGAVLCLLAAALLLVLHLREPSTVSREAGKEMPDSADVVEKTNDVAIRIGDSGSVLDTSRIDMGVPQVLEWAKAGVSGGIPLRKDTPVVARLKPGANVQAALDAAAKDGGVVLLAPGKYALRECLTMRSNVILRGQDSENTILDVPLGMCEGTTFTAVGFHAVAWSGLEDLTVLHTSQWNKKACDRNLNGGILMTGSQDCWVDNCRIKFCNVGALNVYSSKRITLRGNVICGATNNRLNRAADHGVFESEHVLLCNETVLDTVCVFFGRTKGCVVYNCFWDRDVAFEGPSQDMKDVLFEGLDEYHAVQKKLKSPESRFGTLYPLTGKSKSSAELGSQFARIYAEGTPDF